MALAKDQPLTNRTAAEALEEVLAQIAAVDGLSGMDRLEARLDSANAARNFIMKHAATLRAALAPPQEGEAEELARRFEAYADDADQHALLMVPIVAATLRHATRLLRATQSNGRSPPSTAGNTVGQAGLTVGPNFDGESPAQSSAAPTQPAAPVQEPVDVAASSIRNGSTNKGDKMINYTGRHKDSFDRFFASTQKEKPVGWRKDLNPPHGNFTLQWLEENPWPEQNHVQPLYAAPPPDEARELLREASDELDYQTGNDHPLVERIRVFLKDRT